jgi:hypothetical protein
MSDGEVAGRPSGAPPGGHASGAHPALRRGFEGRGEVLRRRRGLLAGAGAAFAVAAAMFLLGAPPWAAVIEEGIAAALFWAWAANLFPKRRAGVLRVDGAGVAVDGEVVVARRRLATVYRASFVVPLVRLVVHEGPAVDLRVERDDDADALVEALGLGLGESTATYSALAGTRPWLLAAVVALLGGATLFAPRVLLLGPHGGAGAAAVHPLVVSAAYGLVVLLVMAGARVNVEVGTDGILLRRPFRQRFVPFEAVADVAVKGAGVVLTLRSGERVGLSGARLRSAPHDTMGARIQQAFLQFEATRGAAGPEAVVAPGGRSTERWVRDLRDAARARHYRQARLDEEALWRVVEDAAAPSATRAGAALALATVDEASHGRLRVAADACAEPRLRVALTRVAEGAGDTELEEALAALLEAER